ncbi:hypothetical protein [Roseivivax sediminis]|uniref:Uncharacterized protein n=1 Tax=Roseivivax sediminis TaxID=936889 RepID=A0A1I1ZE08_9RHOB|nr:hypothetical protein [Roseivivax sediminis]SFE30044.1 hypothetical protein SAMN04515678_108110 [Roseivivax sediminis]
MPLFSRSNTTLPSVSDIDLPEMPEGLAAYTSLIAGAALIGAGLLLRRTEPSVLRLPEPARKPQHFRDVRSGSDAVRATRDGIARFTPRNLTKTLGRSLVLMGAATIAVRMLDELTDDDARY